LRRSLSNYNSIWVDYAIIEIYRFEKVSWLTKTCRKSASACQTFLMNYHSNYASLGQISRYLTIVNLLD